MDSLLLYILQILKSNGLITLHGTEIGGGRRNRIGTIGNNGSWYLSLSRTNVNIFV